MSLCLCFRREHRREQHGQGRVHLRGYARRYQCRHLGECTGLVARDFTSASPWAEELSHHFRLVFFVVVNTRLVDGKIVESSCSFVCLFFVIVSAPLVGDHVDVIIFV